MPKTSDQLALPKAHLSPSSVGTKALPWPGEKGGGGGGGSSSVDRARDSWGGGPGFDSLPTGWVGVSV